MNELRTLSTSMSSRCSAADRRAGGGQPVDQAGRGGNFKLRAIAFRPGQITVNNVNLAMELENLSYFIQSSAWPCATAGDEPASP